MSEDHGLVLGGRRVRVPGVPVLSYLDDPQRVPRARDVSNRRLPIQMVVLHTTMGLRGGTIPSCIGRVTDDDVTLAQYMDETDRRVSWDGTIDRDGSMTWSNDPLESYTWHGNQANDRSVGIEIVQQPDGTVFECQLEAAARLTVTLCNELGVPMQTPVLEGEPDPSVLARLQSAAGNGANVWGVIGHRNITSNKGPGDPSSDVFRVLLQRYNFRGFDYQAEEDLRFWRDEQRRLGVPQTGVPDAATRAALERAGYPRGQLFGPDADVGTRVVLPVGAVAAVVVGAALTTYALWRWRQERLFLAPPAALP